MSGELKNPIDAFHLACELAILAPSRAKSEQATRLAEEIAMMLTPEQVDTVKRSIEATETMAWLAVAPDATEAVKAWDEIEGAMS